MAGVADILFSVVTVLLEACITEPLGARKEIIAIRKT
jgi:hypothetical protein